MPKYNPNSIWGSQKKEATYKPEQVFTPTKPPEKKKEKKAADPGSNSGAHSEARPQAQPQSPARPSGSVVSDASAARVRNPWLWWFSGGVAIILGALIYIFFIVQSGSGPTIKLQFSNPGQVAVGDPFTLTVSYTNPSQNPLNDAGLSLQLPAGISFVGQSAGQRVMEQSVGDLGGNSLGKQDFTLIATGNPDSIQTVQARITYSGSGTAQYESDGSTNVSVGEPSIAMTFNAPSNIFSGQNFDATVNYINNASKVIQAAGVQLQYPPGFTFIKSSSSISGNSGGTAWNIGTLKPGQSGSFTVTGNIVGPEQARYALDGAVTETISGQSYPVNSQEADFVIASSPLSIAVTVNNSSSYIAKLGDSLNYTLTYTNNSDATFNGVTIKAGLTGAMYDLTSVQSDASFDSRSNTLTWYAATTPALSSIAPHQSGSVSFRVSLKSAFPIRLLSDKDYSVKVNAQISSPTVPSNTAGTGTVSAASLENKIGGAIALSSAGYWNDSSSGAPDTGPYPPKVNQTTQYTIHWKITNYSTDAQSVTVSAYLQSGTTFTGKVKSTVSSTPTYDAATGLITWTIPLIPATKGVISAPAEADFQVSNTPAVNQVGSSITLLGAASLQATDAFTGQALTASDQPVTTDLQNDTKISLPLANRRVTQ